MTIEQVHKYPLPLGDWVSVAMPQGAEPIAVQMQNGAPMLWARVKLGNPLVVHHFRIAGTGHELGSNVGRHIGSFQMHGGALIFHVFAGAEPQQ